MSGLAAGAVGVDPLSAGWVVAAVALVALGGRAVGAAVGEVRAGWRARRGVGNASHNHRRNHRAVRIRVLEWLRPAARQREDALTDMVAVLDAVARSLRAGIGIHQAVGDAAVVAGVHRSAIHRVSHLAGGGVPLGVALDEWRRSHPEPPVALATAVLSFSVHTGAPAARAVDGAAATLRERVVLHGEVRALAAQARASAGVVAIAPLVFTVVVSVGDPRVVAWLVGSPAGWVCLVLGVGAEVACVVWMRSLVARAVPQ